MRGQPNQPRPFVSRQRAPDADSLDQQGANPTPTRAPLAPRSASPASYATSGMESALGGLADKLHKPRRTP